MAGTGDVDVHWLTATIELSRLSPRAFTRYAVGAVIVGPAGAPWATGYTSESHPTHHAEEVALAKLAGRTGRDLAAATLYTSLEPCTARRSRPAPCTRLILDAGIRRLVLALREPALLADCDGVEMLRAAGVEVIEHAPLADRARDVNAHLLARAG